MMETMRTTHQHRCSQATPSHSGFSMVEVLIGIVLTSLLAAAAVMMVADSRDRVVETKLRTDVIRLNQIISMYLADGGSLDGLTTPQAVLDKLKTVRTNSDVKRQTSALTGRGVDVRLSTRVQTSEEEATGAARAVWNTSTKRFDLTTSGSGAIADFVLDDTLLANIYPTEARTRSTMLYNDVNGWVWSAGSYTPAAFLSPTSTTLATQENVFDPATPPAGTTTGGTTTGGTTTGGTTTGGTTTGGTTTGGTTTGGTTTGGTTTGGTTTGGTTSTPTQLPKPINTPNGGTYPATTFPTTISINANGAPTSGSQLKYRINNGTWLNYTAPFAINSGDKVESKNTTTNPVLYTDSSTDTDTYFKLVPSFAGTLTPQWNNVAGGPNLTYTTTNTNPDSVSLRHGDTRLDLGGGEYLDAGVENVLTFGRQSPFAGVQPNTDFTLGNFVILNGTTFNDSEATSATLAITINLTSPTPKNSTVSLNLAMVSTPNTSDRLASADTVTINNPTTSFTVTDGGVTYTLQVRLVSQDTNSGVVTGNTFYIYEGASATATLVGKFVSNK
ncbi:MAG: choice-of-anchor K domain-containing protein [Roseimicrobium sp.]